MKKLLIFAAVAVIGLTASAQFVGQGLSGSRTKTYNAGKVAVGLNINFTPCLESGVDLTNFGLAAKLQYRFVDFLRGELLVGYDFENKGISLFHASGNLHFLLNLKENFRVYPIIGAGYGLLIGDFGYWSDNESKFLVNAGLGAEFDINPNIAIGLEVKYQYIKDFSRLPISLGLTYKF